MVDTTTTTTTTTSGNNVKKKYLHKVHKNEESSYSCGTPEG